MASPFWTYFFDRLKWIPILAAGPVQGIAKGIAHRLDGVKEDGLFMRDQWFPGRCEDELVPEHGLSRGLIRHSKETPDMFRQRVVNAWNWNMMGGKQQGLPKILAFYGFNVGEVENLRRYQATRWAEFQLALQDAALATDLDTVLEVLDVLVWLINEYKPARSVLARLYNDVYDLHPTIYSDGPAYSDGLYSYFSGVPASVLGDGYDPELLLSFGVRHNSQAEGLEEQEPNFHGKEIYVFEAPYINAAVYSECYYGDSFLTNNGVFVGTLTNLHACENLISSHGWAGLWDSRRWQESLSWGRIWPDFTFSYRQRSKVQAVYSEAGEGYGRYTGLNCMYGVPEVELVDKAPRYGDSEYSGTIGHRLVTVHEQFRETRLSTCEPVGPAEASSAYQEVCNFAASPASNPGWSGSWDKRTWAGYEPRFFILQPTEEQ
ncbi:phage tail protein [Oleidesulfovibrio sp.]|uniref:phage tail protein n=1 Tax=Oleidesulfovibrio sp. TaxID=2909707 RepID=UPI003A8510F1